MTGIQQVQIQQAIVHKVGNPTRGEQLQLSANPLSLNDMDVKQILTHYFLTPFNENEQFCFSHVSSLELNEVYQYAKNIFENPVNLTAQSVLLAKYLYTKSTHVKIKEGELYVVYFTDLPFNGNHVDAIGIFKSESKETFLKVFQHGQSWEVITEDGININKLDKGCLIVNENKETGYTVCVADNTNKQQDAQYWVKDFLQVTPVANNYRQTHEALSMCKLFIDTELAEKFEVNKTEQIDMLNRSMEYFKTKDHFVFDDFAKEVIHHEEVIDAFTQYKQTFTQAKQAVMEDGFDIHLSAVKKQERHFKSVLKLDKNFHVYIHGRRDLIEKGYDEMKGKQFYKIYYDTES